MSTTTAAVASPKVEKKPVKFSNLLRMFSYLVNHCDWILTTAIV